MLSIEFIVKTVTTGGRRKQTNVQIQLASVTLVTYRTALSQTELSVQNSIESLDQSGVAHVSLQFAFSHLFYFIYFCAELNFCYLNHGFIFLQVGLAFCTLYSLTYHTTWLVVPFSLFFLCWLGLADLPHLMANGSLLPPLILCWLGRAELPHHVASGSLLPPLPLLAR